MLLSLNIVLSLYVHIFSRSDLQLQYVVHLFTQFHSAMYKSDDVHQKTQNICV